MKFSDVSSVVFGPAFTGGHFFARSSHPLFLSAHKTR